MKDSTSATRCTQCRMPGHDSINCPYKFLFKSVRLKKDFYTVSPPTIFVGQHNYPTVNVGVLSPPEMVSNAEYYDDHYSWFKERKTINEIVGLRSQLINSRIISNVKKSEKIMNTFQELTLGKKSVDLEIHLKKEPKIAINSFKTATLIGPNAQLERVELTGNVKVDKKIEKYYYQNDLKAGEAINALYSKGVNELKLARVLSAGALGVRTGRKLVPTRWSITAVDDTLGKNLTKQIKKNSQISDYHVYFGSQLGNKFCVILMPGEWSFELFECWLNHYGELKIGTDSENYSPRKEYANNTAGGYYAARLGVLEQLAKLKKQASAMIIREITGEYYFPVGVWQVRENVRKAFNHAVKFTDFEEVKSYVNKLFPFNTNQVFDRSKILLERKQPKLSHYF